MDTESALKAITRRDECKASLFSLLLSNKSINTVYTTSLYGQIIPPVIILGTSNGSGQWEVHSVVSFHLGSTTTACCSVFQSYYCIEISKPVFLRLLII